LDILQILSHTLWQPLRLNPPGPRLNSRKRDDPVHHPVRVCLCSSIDTLNLKRRCSARRINQVPLRPHVIGERSAEPKLSKEGMIANHRDRRPIVEVRQADANLSRRFSSSNNTRILEERRAVGRVRQSPLLDQAENRLDGRALPG